PASASDALVEARAAMASRDFQRVVNITTEILTNDLMNDDARILGDEAREKLEAGPFVEQFAKKCEQHIAAGNVAAARQDLEKARSLDAGHPLARKIELLIGGGPAPPAPAPGAGHFRLYTASNETSADDKKKIDQYLSDGDRAFDSGEYQQAIDLWSRIFLIDVTNEQASERIERAKLKRRDIESKVEGVVAAGVQAYDRNDHETARAKFTEALRIDPANATAHDYMDRLATTVAEG